MNVNISNSHHPNLTFLPKYLSVNHSPSPRTYQFPLNSPKNIPITNNYHSPRSPIMISPQKLEHINCIIPKKQSIGGIYIGDSISTLQFNIIINNNIQAILCCNIEASTYFLPIENNGNLCNNSTTKPEFKFINIQDHQLYPIHQHFDQTYIFIQNHRNNNKNVLIQCHGGVSRSGTIIIAYLMRKYRWTLQNTYRYVCQRRARIKPNYGFWRQLQQYEQYLKNRSIETSIERNNNQIIDSQIKKNDIGIDDKIIIDNQFVGDNKNGDIRQCITTYVINGNNKQIGSPKANKKLTITLKCNENQCKGSIKNNMEKQPTEGNQNHNPQIKKDKCFSFLQNWKSFNNILTTSYKEINDKDQYPDQISSTLKSISYNPPIPLSPTACSPMTNSIRHQQQTGISSSPRYNNVQDEYYRNTKNYFRSNNQQYMQTKSSTDVKYQKISL